MSEKNFTIKRKTLAGYDILYPKTVISQVLNLQSALDAKQNTIDNTHKLSSDLVDDTSATNKFVNASEKTAIGTAIQPNDNISELTNDSGYITSEAIVTKATIIESVDQPTTISSGEWWYNTINIYSITNTLTHCIASPTNPTTIGEGETATLIFTADDGYILPNSITVTGATSIWTKSTGTLKLSNPVDGIAITIVAEVPTFTITNNLTSCSKSSGPDSIAVGATEILTYTANNDYKLPDTIVVTGASSTWVKSSGTLTISNATDNVIITITADEISQFELPLYLTANTAGSTVILKKNGYPRWTGSYSTDNVTWTDYTLGSTITLTNVGDRVYFRGDFTNHCSNSNYLQFSMTGSISAGGNVNSIYLSNRFTLVTSLYYEYCFYQLFDSCTSLTTAPLLPATTLSYGCYERMFTYTNITTAPSLPATSLANYCYDSMFQRCTSLTTPPALPATTLAYKCYDWMFYYCSSLQVSDTQTSAATQPWVIPTDETFTNTEAQSYVFSYCAGNRASNDFAGAQGQSYTYYTQNTPV